MLVVHAENEGSEGQRQRFRNVSSIGLVAMLPDFRSDPLKMSPLALQGGREKRHQRLRNQDDVLHVTDAFVVKVDAQSVTEKVLLE